MITRSIAACCLLLTLSTPVFSETDKYIDSKIYVPENRLEKYMDIPEGEVYIVRGNVRRMDNFAELWARIVLRNHDQKTLDMWKSESVAFDQKSDYAHLKIHFYCKSSEAAIPALYLFNRWSELQDSRVVMIDEPFSTKDRPVINKLKELACGGNIVKFE